MKAPEYRMTMYLAGMSDEAIAEHECIEVESVKCWRLRHNLKTNHPKKAYSDRRREVFGLIEKHLDLPTSRLRDMLMQTLGIKTRAAYGWIEKYTLAGGTKHEG